MPYLDKSDTHLKLALQVIHSGMWEWNLLTGRVAGFVSVERLFGLSPGTLRPTYRGLLSWISSGECRFVAQVIPRTIRKRTDYAIAFRIFYPDKCIKWLNSQGKMQGDVNPEPVKIISLCQDIISSKQAKGCPHGGAKRRQLEDTGRVDLKYRLVRPRSEIRGWRDNPNGMLRERTPAISADRGNLTPLDGIVTSIPITSQSLRPANRPIRQRQDICQNTPPYLSLSWNNCARRT
jgi:hypothetical protein